MTPSQINTVMARVRRGKATPEEAARLLRDFCERARRIRTVWPLRNTIEPDLFEFVADRVSLYLDAKSPSLEKAFLLKRPSSGKPVSDAVFNAGLNTALEVLRRSHTVDPDSGKLLKRKGVKIDALFLELGQDKWRRVKATYHNKNYRRIAEALYVSEQLSSDARRQPPPVDL
jgi:hypothetical protein